MSPSFESAVSALQVTMTCSVRRPGAILILGTRESRYGLHSRKGSKLFLWAGDVVKDYLQGVGAEIAS